MRIDRKLLTILISLLLTGCFIPNSYKQNCVDIASSAAHTYEHHVKQPAVVCIGRIHPKSENRHAQARGADGKWLTVIDGYLYEDISKELSVIYWCGPVRDFDLVFKVK